MSLQMATSKRGQLQNKGKGHRDKALASASFRLQAFTGGYIKHWQVFFFFNCGILKSHTAALSNNQLIRLFKKKTMWKNYLDMPSFNCDFINILCEPLYLWQAPTKSPISD